MARYKQQLEELADKLEKVLLDNGIKGRVSGGTILPHTLTFNVIPTTTQPIDQLIRAVQGDINVALVANSAINSRGASVLVTIPCPFVFTVKELIRHNPPLKNTALLGICTDGTQLHVNLSVVKHILLVGQARDLVPTILESLALCNPPSTLQFVGNVGVELPRLPVERAAKDIKCRTVFITDKLPAEFPPSSSLVHFIGLSKYTLPWPVIVNKTSTLYSALYDGNTIEFVGLGSGRIV